MTGPQRVRAPGRPAPGRGTGRPARTRIPGRGRLPTRARASIQRRIPGASHRRWSQRVTSTSCALDLEPGVFTRSPRAIAESLKRSAQRSGRRKSSPFRSAMSMLVFYQNRAGRRLSPATRRRLEVAKAELRRLYGRA